MEVVRLNTSTGDDTVQVLSTSAAATTVLSLKSGGGKDRAIVGGAGSLDGIRGLLNIGGRKISDGPPDDTLVVNDSADLDANSYRLTGNFGGQPGDTYTQVWRNGTMLLNAGNMRSHAFYAGAKGDVIRAEDVLIPTAVNAGAGHDRVQMLLSHGTFAPLWVNGQAGIDTLDYEL